MGDVKKPADNVLKVKPGPSVKKPPVFSPKTSIRVHGSGNLIMITEYSQSSTDTKKKIGNRDDIHKALKSGVPVWIDTQRLSKVQLGSVIGAVNTAGKVRKEFVKRNGRPMILVRKMHREE